MAFINIQNSAISIQLAGSESVSVPAGETWKVTILASSDLQMSELRGVAINGVKIFLPGTDVSYPQYINCFVTSGDVISSTHSNVNIHISGFVVQNN